MTKDTHVWLSVKETAARCGISRYTLNRWRRRNHGPKSYAMSDRKILYDEVDVENWISGKRS